MDKSLQKLDSFYIKIIALILMTLDHVAILLNALSTAKGNSALGNVANVMFYIGRIAFPLFAFLLVEGFNHTSNRNKYLFRIGIITAITLVLHINAYYAMRNEEKILSLGGNPLLDLLMCFLTLYFLSMKRAKKFYAVLPISYIVLSFIVLLYEHNESTTILWFPDYLRCSYNLLGLFITLAFYFAPILTDFIVKRRLNQTEINYEGFKLTSSYQKLKNIAAITLFVIVVLIFWIIRYIGMDQSGFSYSDPMNMSIQSYCLIAALPIFFYSGKRGYDSKNFRIFEYVYFPLHVAIIGLLFVILYLLHELQNRFCLEEPQQ